MENIGFVLLFGPLLLCTSVVALHDEGESAVCSSESREEAQLGVHRLINVCFGDSFKGSLPNFNLCDGNGKIDCQDIKRVLRVIPSCHYCDEISTNKPECYIKQQENAKCSINNFLSRITCVKQTGKCRKKIVTNQGFDEVTTFEQTTVNGFEDISTPGTGFSRYSYGRDKEKHDPQCKPCECGQLEKQKGVSVDVAVGLLFVGVAIGAIVTAVICFCVPSLHRTRRLGGKMKEGFSKTASKDDRNHGNHVQQESNQHAADDTLPVETTITYPIVPSAPGDAAGSNQTSYHTLGGMSNSRDSHMYAGLQPEAPEYFEPIGGGDKYQSPENKPMKGPKTIGSPVYQEFADNVIPSVGKNQTKPSANSNSQNQPIRGNDTNDYATNHDYFVLEAQDETNQSNQSNASDNGRPISDHQYFVLEKQKEQQGSDYSEIPEDSDKNYHSYFVLEKESNK